jgi:7-cyano-7-deazaguanine synthase
MSQKAIILFSGGLDSTTCLAIAKAAGYACYTLSFAYGQKHSAEVQRAKEIAEEAGVAAHRTLELPIHTYGGSALTDEKIQVEDYKGDGKVPNTYVPARNTIFLSFAISWGEIIGAYDIFIGANQVDYSGYCDCRPDFLAAFEKVAALGTEAGMNGKKYQIHAPLLQMNKAQIIREGLRLGVDYAQTISCYRADAEGRACGKCDSCIYRKKGFAEAAVKDPTAYA